MIDHRPWIAGAALGAVLGLLLLGVGSRVAMHGVALLAGGPGGFTLGGTATVLFLGVVSGLAGALVFLVLGLVFPRRPGLRTAMFWTFLILITLRGLKPLDRTRLLLFVPLVVAYGMAFQALWGRFKPRGRSDA